MCVLHWCLQAVNTATWTATAAQCRDVSVTTRPLVVAVARRVTSHCVTSAHLLTASTATERPGVSPTHWTVISAISRRPTLPVARLAPATAPDHPVRTVLSTLMPKLFYHFSS